MTINCKAIHCHTPVKLLFIASYETQCLRGIWSCITLIWLCSKLSFLLKLIMTEINIVKQWHQYTLSVYVHALRKLNKNVATELWKKIIQNINYQGLRLELSSSVYTSSFKLINTISVEKPPPLFRRRGLTHACSAFRRRSWGGEGPRSIFILTMWIW